MSWCWSGGRRGAEAALVVEEEGEGAGWLEEGEGVGRLRAGCSPDLRRGGFGRGRRMGPAEEMAGWVAGRGDPARTRRIVGAGRRRARATLDLGRAAAAQLSRSGGRSG